MNGIIRILVVDDDPNISQLIQLYLTREGYEVETSDRGDKALEKFKSNPPNLILLDLMLPGMDGMMVCREVRKLSNIPIIMLYGDADTVVLYEENGKVLEDYYRENGGDLKVICKPGCGHHPHSLEDPTPIIEFVEAHL